MPRGARTSRGRALIRLTQLPDLGLDRRQQARRRATQRLDRRELGRQPAVRARARRRRVAQRGAARRRSRAPGVSGARRSSPRAAQVSSTARIRREVGDRRAQLARRAPAHRDVVLLHRAGRQRVDARRRREAAVLGHHRRLRVLGDHQPGVDARRPAARNGGRPCERAASSSRSVRRSAIAPTSAAAIARKSQASAERRAVEVAARLDPAVGEDHRVVDRRARARPPPRARRGRARRGRRRGPAACSAASRRPARAGRRRGGWRRSPSRRAARRRLAALVGLARAAGAARSGRRRRRGRCRAAPRPTSPRRCRRPRSRPPRSASASTSMPRIPSVPLISARPSLARSDERLDPGVGERLGAPRPRSPSRSKTSPSPISARAQCGERREVAAGAERAVLGDDRGEPGVEQRQHRLGDTGPRARAAHRQRCGRAGSSIARTTSRSTGGPMPGGVRADQRPLQLGRGARPGSASGQRAEPGRDAVGGLVGVGEALDDRRRLAPSPPAPRSVSRADRSSRATAITSSAATPRGPSSIVATPVNALAFARA